jgi:hypothetical protein
MSNFTVRERRTYQDRAIDLMVAGRSISQTARLVPVGRATIHRWLKDDPVFRRALDQRREQAEDIQRYSDVLKEFIESAGLIFDIAQQRQLSKSEGAKFSSLLASVRQLDFLL